jgi:hypothetical protein
MDFVPWATKCKGFSVGRRIMAENGMNKMIKF